jgi:hypothetical protein
MKQGDQFFLATMHGYGCSFLIGSILAIIIIAGLVIHFVF